MYRKFNILAAMLLLALAGYAADAPKFILGARAGYVSSRVTTYGLSTSMKSGGDVGVVFNTRLSSDVPFYFGTGLSFIGKGYQIKGYDDSKTTLNYLELPVNINFRADLGKGVYLTPSAGLFYDFGVYGRLKYNDETIDVFKNKSMSRHDFGFQLGAELEYRQWVIGFSYSQGLVKIDKFDNVYPDKDDMLGYSKLKSRCFSINLGYNFNF